VDAAKEHRPDIVLLDISMPVMNGFEAAQHIGAPWPFVAIIFVTEHSERVYIQEAFNRAAAGYGLRRNMLGVHNAMRVVLTGERYFEVSGTEVEWLSVGFSRTVAEVADYGVRGLNRGQAEKRTVSLTVCISKPGQPQFVCGQPTSSAAVGPSITARRGTSTEISYAVVQMRLRPTR
jgi:CheY-like chemotaxis protein